jgi:D-sedoheptulose 7-phosphate isomerase
VLILEAPQKLLFVPEMKAWIRDYLKDQARIASALSISEIAAWIDILRTCRRKKSQIFACGNGGSAANCSHFAVDLGKGASLSPKSRPQKTASSNRFRILSLNDNVPWITALGNDFSYEDVFVEQLKNYGRAGDVLIAVSVSGNSPNIVKAVKWANANRMITLGLVGNGAGNRVATLAKRAIRVDTSHFGRAEDAQMHVLHLLCYAFMERL